MVSTGVGDWVGAQARRDLCNAGLGDVEVICFEPVPDDTAGEAAIFTDVLEQHELDSAIVVTSNYHASRAALRVRQCFSGRVGVQPADSDRTISNITHEFFGILELSIWDRSRHEENRR